MYKVLCMIFLIYEVYNFFYWTTHCLLGCWHKAQPEEKTSMRRGGLNAQAREEACDFF